MTKYVAFLSKIFYFLNGYALSLASSEEFGVTFILCQGYIHSIGGTMIKLQTESKSIEFNIF